MLYDVLPPLLLFISFGGIIAVVSRVVVRMKDHEFSEEIQAEVESTKPIQESSLLAPSRKGVMLIGNRLKYAVTGIGGAMASVGSSMSAMREKRQEKRELKRLASIREQEAAPQPVAKKEDAPKKGIRGIQMPESGIRDRLAVLAQRGKEGLSSLQQEIAQRVPDPKAVGKTFSAVTRRVTTRAGQAAAVASEQKSSPVIRLVRHDVAQEEPKEDPQEKQKTGIMSHLLKRDKEPDLFAEVQRAIGKKQFDVAEDLLVPYLMKHAGDTKAYMLLGTAAIGREAWDEAMEIFQQVIKLDNKLVDAYAGLGHAALNAGKFTLAIQSLQHARDMDANNVQIREELLFIARRMDNKVVEKGVLEELAQLKENA